MIMLLADGDTMGNIAHSLPLEEPKLPEDQGDDDHDQEAGHDADDHHPDGDVGHPCLRQTVGEGHHADRGLVVTSHLLGLDLGGHLEPRPGVDDHAIYVRVVLHQRGVPHARS